MMTGNCVVCGEQFSYYPSNRSGRYCSQACCRADPEWLAKQSTAKLGLRHSPESKAKMSAARIGKPKPPGHGAKVSAATRGRRNHWAEGSKNWNWKGGITAERRGFRRTGGYRCWRLAVLERDGYRCTMCGSREQLEVDHIEPYAIVAREAQVCNRPDWLLDIANGRTLCKQCHKATPTYRVKSGAWVEVRLIDALEHEWRQNTDQSEPFQRFYERWMEKRINAIKEELS